MNAPLHRQAAQPQFVAFDHPHGGHLSCLPRAHPHRFDELIQGQAVYQHRPVRLPQQRGGHVRGPCELHRGVRLTGFFQAFGYSLFITVFSVFFIVLLTAMTGWFLARVENKVTRAHLPFTGVFHGGAVPDGDVHHVETGQHTASGQPRRHHLRLRRLRGGAFHVHVHRLCPLRAARDRGGRLH